MAKATQEQLKEAAELRASARACGARNQRRIEDQLDPMDCALSSRCDSLSRNLYLTQAEILENGGEDEFWGLFDAETGERLPAKLIDGKYGLCWVFLDASGNFARRTLKNGKSAMFVSAFPKRESTMTKKGLLEKKEMAPAWARIGGNGRGLSGLASAFVQTYRKDGGCPASVLASA